jgi:hypothetical protein
MLRYVDPGSATIWVLASAACDVEVQCGEQIERTPTWSVHGKHFALVVLRGLVPGTSCPYTVRLDGRQVWPPQDALDSGLPHSTIQVPSADPESAGPVRIAFGSCYRAGGQDSEDMDTLGADALVGLARHMSSVDPDAWPHALCLLGDQVYADNPPPELHDELVQEDSGTVRSRSFLEYCALYEHAWSQPEVRWLFSTVPTCMILDDHDLRDDWNTSQSWREEVTRDPHWNELVKGAFSSYWVFQHLGNLSPDELEQDSLFQKVLVAEDEQARIKLLEDFSLRADDEPSTARWSFSRDFGRIRLVMLDSRCSRDLNPSARRMLDAKEWEWARSRVIGADVDHVLVGSSVPVLLMPGIHQLEGWNEAVTQGAWGPRWSKFGEKVRRLLDLEHWSSFNLSFKEMVQLVHDVAAKPQGPATFTWISGDVHCSYVARAELDSTDHNGLAITQLTMSPFRNPLPKAVRRVNRLLGSRRVSARLHWLARRARVDDVGIDWTIEHGPWFRNGVMTIEFAGRNAVVHVDHAVPDEENRSRLTRTRTVELTAAQKQ